MFSTKFIATTLTRQGNNSAVSRQFIPHIPEAKTQSNTHSNTYKLSKPPHKPTNKKHHSHHEESKSVKYYYSGHLAALSLAGLSYALGVGHEALTGKLREKAEQAAQELWPPAVPGNVEMVSLETKMCLPIPNNILKNLQRGFLSAHRKSNTLIISGEGGIGKFDLARQIAFLLRAQSLKPCSTIIEINGHTKESLETGIIHVASKLGFHGKAINFDMAKKFLRTELFKKHRTVIIVRCLRAEAMEENKFPVQDIIAGFCSGWIRPNASIIYTTGQQQIVDSGKQNNFYSVSLSKSYTVQDLLSYVDTLPENSLLKTKIKQEGATMVPLFVNQTLGNNPGYARMAIPYLNNTPTSLHTYMKTQQENKLDMLNISLAAVNDPLAVSLFKTIARLPQAATDIPALVTDIQKAESITNLAAYQKASLALAKLEHFGLIRIDIANNRVYPLMLLQQVDNFLPQNEGQNKASTQWLQWFKHPSAKRAALVDAEVNYANTPQKTR